MARSSAAGEKGAAPSGGRGAAGHAGDGVRSDARVTVELRSTGGIEQAVSSKVEAYYGDAIRAQVERVLGALGVTSARVDIADAGALPFALGARVEAAARRAGADGDPLPVPSDRPPRPPGARARLRRSRLYLPGDEPKYMINAGLYGADGVILDLEDSVHADEKDAARLLVRRALERLDFGGAERMVRINPPPLAFEDLDEVLAGEPDLVLLPKVEDPEEVCAVAAHIEARTSALGRRREVWLLPILETALGVERAFDIARACPQVVALTLGLEDFTADLGVVKTATGEETLYARQRVVIAARAAGVGAIDSVFGDVGDEEGLRAWGARARAIGFVGMGCVHPRQIPIIHEAFAPSERELARAQRIVTAFEEAQARGSAVVSLGNKMIDPPVVERARRLVERARAMGLLDGEGATGERPAGEEDER